MSDGSQSFGDKMRDFFGVPKEHENPDVWAHKRADPGILVPSYQIGAYKTPAIPRVQGEVPETMELAQGAIGWIPEIRGKLTGLLYGKEYGEAYEKAEREKLREFEKAHPGKAQIIQGAGILGAAVTGEGLLEQGGKALLKRAPGLAEKAAPVVRGLTAAQRVAKKAAIPAAVLAGGVGASRGKGYIDSASNAAEWAAATYRAAGRIPEASVAAALGAYTAASQADPEHRWEAAEEGARAGVGAQMLLPAAGKLVAPYAKKAATVTGRLADRATGYRISNKTAELDNFIRSRFNIPEGQPISDALRNSVRRLSAVGKRGAPMMTNEEIAAENARRASVGQKPLTAYEVANQPLLSVTRASGRQATRGRATALRSEVRKEAPGEVKAIAQQTGVGFPEQVEEKVVPSIVSREAHSVGSVARREEHEALQAAPHETLREQVPPTGVTVEQHAANVRKAGDEAAETEFRGPGKEKLASEELFDLLEDPKSNNIAPKFIRNAVRGAEVPALYRTMADEKPLSREESVRVVEDLGKLREFYDRLDKFEVEWSEGKADGLSDLDPAVRKQLDTMSPTTRARALTAYLREEGKTVPETMELPEFPDLGAATVHRIERYLRNQASTIKNQDLASALFAWADRLREHVLSAPGFETARANYLTSRTRSEATENFSKEFGKTTGQFVDWVGKNPEARNDMRVAFEQWLGNKFSSKSAAESFYKDIRLNTNGIRDKIAAFWPEKIGELTKVADRSHVLNDGMKMLLSRTPAEEYTRWFQSLHPEAQRDVAQIISDHLTGLGGDERTATRLAESIHNNPNLQQRLVQTLGADDAGRIIQAAERVDVIKTGVKKLYDDTEDFKKWFDGLSPDAQKDMQRVLQKALTPTGEHISKESAHILNLITEHPYLMQNVEHMFGGNKALVDNMLASARALGEKARRSIELSGAGSTTTKDLEDREFLEDKDWIEEIMHGITNPKRGMLNFLNRWVNEGNRVTPEEANAIWDMMEGDPHTLADVVRYQPNGFLANFVRDATATARQGFRYSSSRAAAIHQAVNQAATPTPASAPTASPAVDDYSQFDQPTAAPAQSASPAVDDYSQFDKASQR